MKPVSANFEFLGKHDAQLVRLGALAERYFKDDPNTCLIKLRQFGEVLAQLMAAKPVCWSLRRNRNPIFSGVSNSSAWSHAKWAISFISSASPATGHPCQTGDHAEALSTLKIARQLGIWFQRTFGNAKVSAGAFVPPPIRQRRPRLCMRSWSVCGRPLTRRDPRLRRPV